MLFPQHERIRWGSISIVNVLQQVLSVPMARFLNKPILEKTYGQKEREYLNEKKNFKLLLIKVGIEQNNL